MKEKLDREESEGIREHQVQEDPLVFLGLQVYPAWTDIQEI